MVNAARIAPVVSLIRRRIPTSAVTPRPTKPRTMNAEDGAAKNPRIGSTSDAPMAWKSSPSRSVGKAATKIPATKSATAPPTA
jgi:hypothetical protein